MLECGEIAKNKLYSFTLISKKRESDNKYKNLPVPEYPLCF